MASADAEKQGEQAGSKSVPIYNVSSSHEHSHSCNDPSHHHHNPYYPSFFDHNNEQLAAAAAAVKNDPLSKRKAKKTQKQAVTRAELIPGHRGDSSIDELVNFINGPATANGNNASKKSKKKAAISN